MPLVTIEWTPGRSQEQRNQLAERVVNAMCEIADLAPESIWVKFHEVEPDVWYVGSESIAARRRVAKVTADT